MIKSKFTSPLFNVKIPDSEKPLQKATEIIEEHGCPICDELHSGFAYNGGATIQLGGCGHSVSTADARRQEHLQEEIDPSKFQDCKDG